jgi:hypothetical protein
MWEDNFTSKKQQLSFLISLTLNKIVKNFKSLIEEEESLFGNITELSSQEKNLARYLGESLMKIAQYLDIESKFLYSSDIGKENDLKFDERIINICQTLNEDHYINAIGGQELYIKEEFAKKNIRLDFIKSSTINYKQFNDNFIADLSIIDVMMFNSKDEIKAMLNKYCLI